MKVYDIEYSFEKEIELIKPEGSLDGEFEELEVLENQFETIVSHIQIGNDNFHEATFEATDILDEVFGEVNYTILCVQEIPMIDILNWPGEGEPCNCPQCKADRMSDEDVMHFNCPECNEPLKTANDEWEYINCRKCGMVILRDNIIYMGKNKFKAIKIKDIKED